MIRAGAWRWAPGLGQRFALDREARTMWTRAHEAIDMYVLARHRPE